jgi:hypothetical protein
MDLPAQIPFTGTAGLREHNIIRTTMRRSMLRQLLLLFPFFLSLLHAQPRDVSSSEIQRITNDASYDFNNIKMYKDEAAWRGKTVAFSGYIQKTPVIAKTKGEYLQIAGNTANGAVNVVVFLDGPIPTTDNFGNPVPTLSPGMDVWVFLQVRSVMNFVSETGVMMSLPTGDALLIFSKDDYSMTHPVWASSMLMRRR